jgi:uncharacterized membrane protein
MKDMTTRRVVPTMVLGLALTGIVIVVLRAIMLAEVASGLPASTVDYDHGFALRPGLTFMHIIPGMVFVILGPLQFVQAIRTRHIRIHRWCGRLYVASGFLVGATACIMGFLIGFGGPTETAAVSFYSVLFMAFLGLAVASVLRRKIAAHREWMIRAFALGLAVTTMRPLIAVLLATTGLPFKELLGLTFWVAFTLHLIVAELWVTKTRRDAVKPNGSFVEVQN